MISIGILNLRIEYQQSQIKALQNHAKYNQYLLVEGRQVYLIHYQ